MLFSLALACCAITGCPAPGQQGPVIGIDLIATGFTSPVAMAVPADGTNRLFIVDQAGLIRIVDAGGSLLAEPFLDVRPRMVTLNTNYDERGLLGLAFHPDFAVNGRFFVFYTAPLDAGDPADFNVRSHLSELRVSAVNPDRADPDSEIVLLEILKPQSNHNGGQLAFGPDGLLYVGTGDGGGANDIGDGHTPDIGNAQDRGSPLGKILRYNADTPGTLNVPADNPFADEQGAVASIYAYGLRNPWRFSFDSGGDRRLFCADVGQNLYEEANIIVSGGNYGWNRKEGSRCFNPDNPLLPPAECPAIGPNGEDLIDPVMEYSHNGSSTELAGTAVIGGFVYRGSSMPELAGSYIFGDWSRGFSSPDGSIFLGSEQADGSWQVSEAGIAGQPGSRLNRFLLAFGQDQDNEIYLLTSQNAGPAGTTGEVLKLVPGSSTKESRSRP